MKCNFFILLMPILVLTSCNNTNVITINAEYCDVMYDNNKNIYLEKNSSNFILKFEFEKSHVLTKKDINSLEESLFHNTPLDVRGIIKDNEEHGYYTVYTSFNLKELSFFNEGDVLNKNYKIYYGLEGY